MPWRACPGRNAGRKADRASQGPPTFPQPQAGASGIETTSWVTTVSGNSSPMGIAPRPKFTITFPKDRIGKTQKTTRHPQPASGRHSTYEHRHCSSKRALDQLEKNGFDTLTDTEKTLATTWLIEAGVNNGGFVSFSPAVAGMSRSIRRRVTDDWRESIGGDCRRSQLGSCPAWSAAGSQHPAGARSCV